MNHPLGGKTSIAVGVMLTILAVPYFTPRLEKLRVAHAPWQKNISADPSALAQSPVIAAPVLTQGETKVEASENQATITNALPGGPTEPVVAPSKAKEETPSEKAATPSAAP